MSDDWNEQRKVSRTNSCLREDTSARVCAAIVSYHPGDDFERAVRLLRPQVHRLLVVDNHSDEPEIEKLRRIAQELDLVLIENPDNYGLGAGLNQSIEWAKRQKDCEFILFLDQDSFPSEDFVAQMVAEYKRHSESERVFLVMPSIILRRTGDRYHHYEREGKYLVAQTSGSLIPIKIFADEGLYKEDLFVDYVDYEFCLRAASHGWTIACCHSAVLHHDPGTVTQLSIFGLRKIAAANYSPLRRYYLMRNGIWTIRKYRGLHPEWAATHSWQMLKGILRVLLFEQNRASTIVMWLRAIRDVHRSRFGKYPRAMNA
jgi:rhamnosyltransferase